MAALGRIPDIQLIGFMQIQGLFPKRPLFPKADIQIGRNWVKLGSAFGQKQTFSGNLSTKLQLA